MPLGSYVYRRILRLQPDLLSPDDGCLQLLLTSGPIENR